MWIAWGEIFRKVAAPILWELGMFWFFLLENPHAHKIPRFRDWLFLEGEGWKCQFYFYGWGFSEISFWEFNLPCRGDPPPKKKPSTQIRTQFAQTLSEQFVQTVPLFPVKQAEKRQKSLYKLFAHTVFIWVGSLLGGLPSLDNLPCILMLFPCSSPRFVKSLTS